MAGVPILLVALVQAEKLLARQPWSREDVLHRSPKAAQALEEMHHALWASERCHLGLHLVVTVLVVTGVSPSQEADQFRISLALRVCFELPQE